MNESLKIIYLAAGFAANGLKEDFNYHWSAGTAAGACPHWTMANCRLRPIHSGMRILTELDRARSRLYQSQSLQENMRLKALAEIYTVHLH